MDGVDTDEGRGSLPDEADKLLEGARSIPKPLEAMVTATIPVRPSTRERRWSISRGPFGSNPGPPHLAAVAAAPDILPGRDVGHVIEIGNNEIAVVPETKPRMATARLKRALVAGQVKADLFSRPRH